jgi:hypothetical protein
MKRQGYREAFFDGLNYYFVTDDIQVELVQRGYHLLITEQLSEQFNKTQQKLEYELGEATSLTASILEHPENYISHRSMLKALLIQLRRRLHL